MNEDNIISSYKQVRSELGKYSKELLNKNEIIVLNKIDLIDQYKLDKKVREFNIKIKKKTLLLSTLDKKSVSKIKSSIINYVS